MTFCTSLSYKVLLPALLRSTSYLVVPHRTSVYNPTFIEPIFKKDDLQKLFEEGGHVEKAFLPIKAATTDKSTSIFRDDDLNKFTNMVMEMGKKRLARDLIERGFLNIKMIQIETYHKAAFEEKETIELNPLKLFHQAIYNCKPILDLTPIKRGAIVYRVPIAITDKRAKFKAMKWLIEEVNDKHRKIHFPEKFAWEVLAAARNEGKVVKRKQDWHKQCESNKAYAHYRWR